MTEQCATTRRRGILIHIDAWMNLEDIQMVNQAKIQIYGCRQMRHLEYLNSQRRIVTSRDPGDGRIGTLSFNRYSVSFQKLKMFHKQAEVLVTIQCKCTFYHCTVQFKMVQQVNLLLRIFLNCGSSIQISEIMK